MHTELDPTLAADPTAQEAVDLLKKCVHCGFCNATCPSYTLLGDELDGPRGRIWQIKQVLEGEAPTRGTQRHLDRCLTCRNCETTCPSGVEYGKIVDVGRDLVEQRVPRRTGARVRRWLLKEGLTSPLFGLAVGVGRALRPLLPQPLRAKLGSARAAGPRPRRKHARKVLLPLGCVQPTLAPRIDAATARVLDAIGIETVPHRGSGCCGALRFHLDDQDGALAQARANIDAWWPLLESGEVESIVSNASGCGVMMSEYGRYLKDDPAYAEKAVRVAAAVRDLSALMPEIAAGLAGSVQARAGVVAFHPPCTLQHGLKVSGVVEQGLARLGFDVRRPAESHLCCGSAGTFSVLQPELADPLRDRKLGHLEQLDPLVITSANVGCIGHLQAGGERPVMHWIEWIDDGMQPADPAAG